MKINVFLGITALVISALLGYLIGVLAVNPQYSMLYGVLSGVIFACTLVPMTALKHPDSRIGTNIRVMSTLFLVIFFIFNICCACFDFSLPIFIIVNGILLMVFLGGIYKLSKVVLNQEPRPQQNRG